MLINILQSEPILEARVFPPNQCLGSLQQKRLLLHITDKNEGKIKSTRSRGNTESNNSVSTCLCIIWAVHLYWFINLFTEKQHRRVPNWVKLLYLNCSHCFEGKDLFSSPCFWQVGPICFQLGSSLRPVFSGTFEIVEQWKAKTSNCQYSLNLMQI